jgi:hypothetical protein
MRYNSRESCDDLIVRLLISQLTGAIFVAGQPSAPPSVRAPSLKPAHLPKRSCSSTSAVSRRRPVRFFGKPFLDFVIPTRSPPATWRSSSPIRVNLWPRNWANFCPGCATSYCAADSMPREHRPTPSHRRARRRSAAHARGCPEGWRHRRFHARGTPAPGRRPRQDRPDRVEQQTRFARSQGNSARDTSRPDQNLPTHCGGPDPWALTS